MPRQIEPKSKSAQDSDLCHGGKSYGCMKVLEYSKDGDGNNIYDKESYRTLHPHKKANPVNCRKCGTYMGCRICAQPPCEMVCLNCRDWATKESLATHGRMVRDPEKLKEAWKIVRMRESGSITDNDVDRLFADLWATP